jgi:hypothetical protein
MKEYMSDPIIETKNEACKRINLAVFTEIPESKESETQKNKIMKITSTPIKRIVSETDKWTFSQEELKPSAQYDIICPIFSAEPCDLSKNHVFIMQQIRNKISSYKSQDTHKSKFDPAKFVTERSVLDLFEASRLQCYYCKEPTLVLYEIVRDPKQWSLERLDNRFGHNSDNVVLSCLQCNLRRRCMHSDRYLKTKQMTKVVKLTAEQSALR